MGEDGQVLGTQLLPHGWRSEKIECCHGEGAFDRFLAGADDGDSFVLKSVDALLLRWQIGV